MMKKIYKLSTLLFAFSLLLTNAKAFTDVPVDSWFYPYVQDLVGKGIVNNAEKYRPEDELNRAELVKMVIIATDEDNKEELPGHPTFNDVPHNEWFAPFVERAATLGIVSGYSDPEGNLNGWFGPGDDVTRAQAVKILVEAFDLQDQNGNVTQFKDVAASDWFYNYVYIASDLGVVEGYDDGTFKPNQAVKRSEMAKMLSLAMNPKQAEPETPEAPENPEEPGETPEEPGNPEEPSEIPEDQEVFKPNASNITPSIAVASGEEKFVGKYVFEGQLEGFNVETLTVVNDTTGNNLGDDPKSSQAIKNVVLKFASKDGYSQTVKKPLNVDGTARFSGLNFFIKKDAATTLEIYAELNTFADTPAETSGETFALGIQNVNNTINSFKATGEFSDDTITLGDEGLSISNSDVETFVVRKSAPTFELVNESGTLVGGTSNLISLKITADENGSISLGRLVFEVDVDDDDNANLTLKDFSWLDESNVIENVNIYDSTGGQDLTSNGGGSIIEGSSKIIVSFDEEEIISAGQTKTYHLKANVVGSANDDTISTKLSTSDDNTPLSGLSKTGQENTGKIFVNGDTTAGIFTISDTDFSQLAGNARNILWSDLSAKSHQYPEVTSGSVTSDSGTSDWTNGYRLGVNSLESSVLTK